MLPVELDADPRIEIPVEPNTASSGHPLRPARPSEALTRCVAVVEELLAS
jgi:hypothetical protein